MSQISIIILSVVAALVCFAIITIFAISYYMFCRIIKRAPYTELGASKTEKRKVVNGKRKIAMEEFKKIEKENLEILSFDNLTLRAKLWRSDNSKKIIICVHGYTSHPAREFANISPFLHGLGYNILYLNDRAHADSDGKYVGFSVLDRYDLQKWIFTATKMFGDDSSIFLYGISMGASTAALVSGMDIPATVKGIIFDSGFTSPWDELKIMLKSEAHLPAFPFLYIMNMFNIIFAKYSLKDTNVIDYIKDAKIPFIFFRGTDDIAVSMEMTKEIYDACPTAKELHIVEGAEHVGAYYHDTKLYENSVKAFLKRNE
ncbi:MAG: alpha/beta hydrolase [Clostridia bacterium]|nr:alpha/beta hydrolase [Clostridia bacterium]